MALLDQINEDIKTAMKEKNTFDLSVIRMLKGAIQLELIKKKELNDEDIIGIVSKQVKMRKDSIEEFKKGNRDDLVEQYEKEIEVLNKYLPEQLTIEEVNKILDEAFNKINPTSNKEMGLIMKEISPKVKGRYDMQEISKLIKERLS